MDQKLVRQHRMAKLKLQIEKLELERRIEEAIASGNPNLIPFVKAAEDMVKQIQECFDKHEIRRL